MNTTNSLTDTVCPGHRLSRKKRHAYFKNIGCAVRGVVSRAWVGDDFIIEFWAGHMSRRQARRYLAREKHATNVFNTHGLAGGAL